MQREDCPTPYVSKPASAVRTISGALILYEILLTKSSIVYTLIRKMKSVIPIRLTVRKERNPLFTAFYTHPGVQQLVRWIMDTQGIGQFELSKRAGLSPAAVFQILNKTEKQVTRPSRRSTLSALAQTVGAEVQFDSARNLFALMQKFELPETDSKDLGLLLSEIGDWIISRRKRMTRQERDRIVRVVKAVLP